MARRDGFKRGTGCYTCVSCGKQTRETPTNRDAAFNRSCQKCWDEGGWINAHEDGMHEPGSEPECPLCQKEADNGE